MTSEECGELKGDGEPCEFPAKYPDGKCGHHTEHTDSTRKSLLEETPSIADLIEGEIQNGATIGEACAEANIGRGTHDGWMARGKDDDDKDVFKKYRRKVTRARRTAAKNERRQLKVMCAEEGDTRTYWKIHQEQYGDLYAGESEDESDVRPVFNVPEDIADKWQPVKQ